MTHYNIIPQANVRDSFGFTPPVDGLDYLNFFTSSARLTRNLILGGASAEQLGSPEYLTGYTRFDGGTDGVQTDIILGVGNAITICVVAKSPDAAPSTTIPTFASTYYNSPAPTSGLFFSAANTGFQGAVVLENGGVVENMNTIVAGDETAWRFVAMMIDNRAPGLTSLRLVDKTAGVAISTSKNYNLMPTDRPLRIGGSWFPANAAVADMAFAAVKSGMMTDAEIQLLYALAKSACALDGITI